jgi:uncharacterized membrane protein (UPF0136 family)
MIKQTHAYRAALVLLADALARQDPAGVMGYIREGSAISDLSGVMQRRHPDFAAAMFAKVNEPAEGRKQARIVKRRATTHG